MSVVIMTTAESKSKSHHGWCVNGSDINGSRVDDRRGCIHNRGLLHQDRLLNHDLLRSSGHDLGRLLPEDWLRLLIDHLRRLLHHYRCRCDVNRVRSQRFRDDNSCSNPPDHPGGNCGAVAAMRLRSRNTRAKQSHCCHCYQGLFHTFFSLLFCWLGRSRC